MKRAWFKKSWRYGRRRHNGRHAFPGRACTYTIRATALVSNDYNLPCVFVLRHRACVNAYVRRLFLSFFAAILICTV